MTHSSLERLIALAGIYQAVHCVARMARQGTADTAAIEPCIHSLFQIDADNVDAVFGKPGAVIAGARQIAAQVTGEQTRSFELTRYVVLLMRLERNLAARPDLLACISAGLKTAEDKRQDLELLNPDLMTHFANLYSETLSHLEPKVVIRGESLHLRNADNQNKIRALLLAGVRAARLWRQVGGSRWQILFKNKQILADAQRYINRYPD